MSECKLDHTVTDVLNKLKDQTPYLPDSISEALHTYLQVHTLEQPLLNELFHLLKKYDLASKEEQTKRNQQLNALLS